jgi:GT2 family glycosyltransferase
MVPPSENPLVIVIILTFNQKEKTLECLSSLSRLGESPFGTIVWDNGSMDGSEEAVRLAFPNVLVHHHPSNLGVAEGRNAAADLAIRQLGATHLLFLDNDIRVEPGFVQALINPFCVNPQLGQTQAKLLSSNDHRRINNGGGVRINYVFWQTRPIGFSEIDYGQYDTPQKCVCTGGAMMVRVDIFKKLGGFDPQFGPFGPEDLDFSLRLQRMGYDTLYIPHAVGYHQTSHTFGKGYTEVYTRHKSRHWMIFMKRHATPFQKVAFYLIGAPYLAVSVTIREGKRGNWKAIRGLLHGVFGKY